MSNTTFPKTDAAVDFIKSFGDMKRIIAVAEMVEICKSGDNSEQDDWVDFLRRSGYTPLAQMSDELCRWIDNNIKTIEEGEDTVQLIEDYYLDLQETLTQENVLTKILVYNKKLKDSKDKTEKSLMISPDTVDNSMWIINTLLAEFESHIESVEKCFEEKKEDLKPHKSARRGVMIDHRLRWNEGKKEFQEFIEELIDDECVTLPLSKGGEKEIKAIFEAVFERVTIEYSQKELRESEGRLPLSEVSFEIPEKLFWNQTPKDFKERFACLIQRPSKDAKKNPTLVDPESKTIFIVNFDERGKGETPAIANILTQVFIIPKKIGTGNFDKNSLVTYLNK